MNNHNYRNKEWLYQKYVTEGLSAPKIVKLCGLKDEQSVYNYMKKYGISRRGFKSAAILMWKARGVYSPRNMCSLQLAYKEARRVWEEWHMMKLPRGWVVHHRDYNPWNNEIWNLWALPRSIHNKVHKTFVPRKKKREKQKTQRVKTSLHTQEPIQVVA